MLGELKAIPPGCDKIASNLPAWKSKLDQEIALDISYAECYRMTSLRTLVNQHEES